MPDEDDVGTKIEALTAKVDGLQAQLARSAPMTPGRAAAQARELMRSGYEAAAAERATAEGEETP
jgi:hypothetical protein